MLDPDRAAQVRDVVAGVGAEDRVGHRARPFGSGTTSCWILNAESDHRKGQFFAILDPEAGFRDAVARIGVVSTISTKADDIAGVLEDEIVAGLIPPGTVLRQETLSERFDVSRTPVREALRRLAALGLVSFEPNRGVRVRSISADELHEAFLVRAELEALATEVATPKMTPDDLAEMDRVERRFGELTLELRDQARSGAPRDAALFVEWMQANYAFHDVIYRVAELPLVERIAKGARRTFIGDRAWRARAELDELYAKNDLQHRAIREAISAGSAQAARILAREHVLSSNRLIEVVLETLGAAGREPGWGR
ncbi:MAG: GntR family transcriptional regulator [Gaiella sp.]|nr:GntR family transcriptional regulator [Gaiella sp.]